MRSKSRKSLSVLLCLTLLASNFFTVPVFANTSVEIFDKNKTHIIEKQYLTEYSSHQLYAMIPVTAEDGTVTGTEIDTSQGAYVTWESNLPLLANVDSSGKVTAYDFSKRAVIEHWINENIRVLPLIGDSTADAIWETLDSSGTDLDDMSTDAIVAIVSAVAGETLGESLRKVLDNMNVEITATYCDSDGNVLGTDKVEFVIEKSLIANIAPTGVHITNKSTVPTTVAVGATVQLRGFCTPTRLDQGVKFSMGSSAFDTTSKNYATVTEGGLVTFTAPGQATVRVNPESTLYATFSDTITFTILDPADLPVVDFEISGSTSVVEGETTQLEIGNVTPAGAYYGDLTWESADPTIAVIDQNGVVTGLDGGSGLTYSREVTITATAGGVSKDVVIKVTRPIINKIASVEIIGDDSLSIDTTGVYTATVKPDRINNSSSVKREWGVIDPLTNEVIFATEDTPATDGAVSVDINGNVTAIGAGVSVLYCKATLNNESVEDTKTIVCGKAITDFEITGTSSLKEGEKTTLNISVLAPDDYETALLDTVIWSIADESIASISEKGEVLARDAGKKTGSQTTTVTATVSGISKTFSLTVKGNGLLSTDKLTDGSVEGVDNVIVDFPRKYTMNTYPQRIEGKATYWAISPDDGSEPWNVSDSYDGTGRITENSFASISETTENDVVYGIVTGKSAGPTAIHSYKKNSSLIGTGKSYVEAHKNINIIEVEPKSITIKTPDKLEYLEGDTELDLTGLEVYLNYDREVIGEYYPDIDSYTDSQLTVQVTDYTVGTFDPEIFDITQYVIVAVTRAGKTYNAVIPVVVKSKVVTALNITIPSKQAYIEGDTELSLNGLKATVDYENFDSETVTPQIDYSSFSFSILNTEQQVRVYYTHAGRTVENFFPITVFQKPTVNVEVDGTIGRWTKDKITFTLSCDNPLENVYYYYKFNDGSSYTRATDGKLVISGQREDSVCFKAILKGTAYGDSVSITTDETKSYKVMHDSIEPDFEFTPETTEFTNNNFIVNVEDLVYGISGIEYIKYNGEKVSDSFRSFTVKENGTHTVEIKTVVGLVTTKSIEISNIDKENPQITDISVTQQPEDAPCNKFDGAIGEYYSGNVKATVSAEDYGVSGIDNIYYRLADDSYTPTTEWEVVPSDNTIYCSEQFKGFFEFKVVDKAGNESASVFSNGFVRDSEKPIITDVKAVCGENDYTAGTWADDYIEFTPTASAYSGIKEYYYNIDGSEWTKLTKDTLLAKDNGEFTYNFKAVSKTGLESDVYTLEVKIDRTVPVIRVAVNGTIGRWTNEDVTFTVSTFNDCPSGRTFYYNDGSGWKVLSDNTLVINYSSNNTYSFKAVNGAGLHSVPSDEYKVMVDKVTPSADIIYSVSEKTDSPYDITVSPIVGEAGCNKIYFNGEDITQSLKYTVSKNGTYALTIIGNNMLSNTVMVDVTNFSSLTSMVFDYGSLNNEQLTVTAYNGNAKNVTVPISINCLKTTEISDGAFENNEKIKSITIPNTVSQIGNAFAGCSQLTEIYIPESVSSISPNAFDDCPDITIYCKAGSYAESYAKEYNIPYVVLDVSPQGNTLVNTKTGHIFTQEIGKTDITQIASVGEGCTIMAIPSYTVGGINYYGTGSVIYVFKNGVVEDTYTLIVQGDINGDGFSDVLDMALAVKAQKNVLSLEESNLLAADFDNDGIIEKSDYEQVSYIALNN